MHIIMRQWDHKTPEVHVENGTLLFQSSHTDIDPRLNQVNQ